ncbi:UDP-N-acetylglucosamine 2-epimerase, partial [Candidatus Bipolaricaulota bacterium]|nr:UDP-N-acetylglucosamine 2-epimerase [Candidatus Bipolaricaulota bacterium]
MKIVTILGTRPEIIRLSCVIGQLDELCDHVLVHTGQNYDERLSDLFFDELGVRTPDHFLGARGPFGAKVGKILAGCDEIINKEKPNGV